MTVYIKHIGYVDVRYNYFKRNTTFANKTKCRDNQYITRQNCSNTSHFVTFTWANIDNIAYLRTKKQYPITNNPIEMKNFCYALLLLLCVGCTTNNTPREGDIIFITDKHNLPTHLGQETPLLMNHCGVIVVKEDGMYVLHVNRKVMLTPLGTFIRRGIKSQYAIMRATNKKVNIDSDKYLHKDDDILLLPDNDEYYNSELVYEIYKNDLGIELCQPRMVKEHDVSEMIYFSNKYYVKPNNPIITTTDLYNSKELKLVQTHEDRLKKIKEAKKQE